MEQRHRSGSGPTDPRTAADIAAALRAVHEDSLNFWRTIGTAEFFAPIGAAWSPADNVRHLTKSVRAVSAGLRAPRWVLWLAFRSGSGTSRSYAEVREVYLARLARGASAGKFAPGPLGTSADPDADRARVMKYHAAAIGEMAALVVRWQERWLDRFRIPHPLLGPLSVREMLFFTVYHNRHHVDVVRRRLAASTA
jgi:hypothetical protein